MRTLEDDIAWLRELAGQAIDGETVEAANRRLDRLAKAVGERGHLEEAARLIRLTTLGASLVTGSREGSPEHGEAVQKWLKADRERERKRGEPVLKSTP